VALSLSEEEEEGEEEEEFCAVGAFAGGRGQRGRSPKPGGGGQRNSAGPRLGKTTLTTLSPTPGPEIGCSEGSSSHGYFCHMIKKKRAPNSTDHILNA